MDCKKRAGEKAVEYIQDEMIIGLGTGSSVYHTIVKLSEKVKLVCFDLDDTLIREIHSVMLPCILNGKENEHSLIQKQEELF
ncbi:hypothetical protein [Clostridium sp.]|uniref:hypothetical protein n=1 Tax=Clostridium sp. TaxID=1506 RepID=UPI00345BE6E8